MRNKKSILRLAMSGLLGNEDGFTMGETIFSITISLIVSASLFFAYSAVAKGMASSRGSLMKAYALAAADANIRKQIRSLEVPYWSDGEKEIAEFCSSIAGEHGKLWKIVSCHAVRSGGVDVGIRCSYTISMLSSEVFTTEEKLCFVPLLERKR